jgi:hypothetical protein
MIQIKLILAAYILFLLQNLYFLYFLARELGWGIFSWTPWPSWIWRKYLLEDFGGVLILICIILMGLERLLSFQDKRESAQRMAKSTEDFLLEHGIDSEAGVVLKGKKGKRHKK